MAHIDRRDFLRAGVTAGAGFGISLLGPRPLVSSPQLPALSIARYKTSPTDPDGIAEEARRLTRQAIDALGGMGRFVSKGNVVWIKPDIGWDRRPEQAATTNPDVVATLVAMCYQAGAKKVLVSDNPCNPARLSYPRSGIQPAAEKAGAEVPFLDERKFRKMSLNGKVLKEWEVYQDIVEADRLINVPIVKNHNLCLATLGMKNLMGVIGGARNRLHQDLGGTLVDLAAFLKPRLVVLDAIRVLTANGPVGGNLADVKRKDTLVAGVDQVAVDAAGATLLGYKPDSIGYIVQGNARGLGTIDFKSLSPKQVEV
ncbi:MAG: DUF362 domain-containing protein [Terriglobia bacterium]|jgi:uncharacterized protein (DUF362 family)